MSRVVDGMTALDRAILHRVYEPVSKFAGRHFGATVAGLSRGCIGPLVLCVTLRVALDAANGASISWKIFWAGIFLPMMGGQIWLSAKKAERWPNTNFVALLFTRIIWLLIPFLFDLPVVLSGVGAHSTRTIARGALGFGGSLSVLSGIYFASLPPAPPKKQRAPSHAGLEMSRG